MSKNSTASARHRPASLREKTAQFRGIHSVDELEDMLEDWADEEIPEESPRGDYRFISD